MDVWEVLLCVGKRVGFAQSFFVSLHKKLVEVDVFYFVYEDSNGIGLLLVGL